MKKRVDFVSMVKATEEADVMINFLKYRYQKGYSTLIIVIGARGTGKTSVCYRLDEKNNKVLNPLRVKDGLKERKFGTLITSYLDLIGFVKNSQQGDQAILEEISVLFPSRRSMSSESVGFSQVLDIIRKKRLIIFANCPMALSADKNIRSSANAMVQTYKIIKSEGVVLSRFWKMQPNYLSGKIYMHKFTRGGSELDFMYTKKPDDDRWEDYEKSKDSFIDEQYDKLLKKAEKKRDKELKELGYTKIERKPLTEKQQKVMETLAKHTFPESKKILGIALSVIHNHKKLAMKKGYSLEEFKNKAINEVI